jgi:hypothetical protein
VPSGVMTAKVIIKAKIALLELKKVVKIMAIGK